MTIPVVQTPKLCHIARNRSQAQAPGLWKGLAGAWSIPTQGMYGEMDPGSDNQTGTLINLVSGAYDDDFDTDWSAGAVPAWKFGPYGCEWDSSGTGGKSPKFASADTGYDGMPAATAMCLMKTSGNQAGGIMGKFYDGADRSWDLQVSESARTASALFATDLGNNNTKATTSAFPSGWQNEYHLIAGSWSNSDDTTRCWVDGKHEASVAKSGNVVRTNTARLAFGGNGHSGDYAFNGAAEGFYVLWYFWNRALSATEHAALARDPFLPLRRRRRKSFRGSVSAPGGGGTIDQTNQILRHVLAP